nr:hypothetical protein [uncultured Mediterranean phage uvMED]
MKRINLSSVLLEVTSDESLIDSFHPDAVWSIYDSNGNIFSLQKQTYFDLRGAIQIAAEMAEMAESGEQVTVRWEAESIDDTLVPELKA